VETGELEELGSRDPGGDPIRNMNMRRAS